ncbi:zinc transporter 10 [Brachionus plicatilis]|uniref:Zinc transporter 10 n=1 Tax=Brachionus plicatilis TaxID=10195 RepID=A0A3M7P467_BRAPC|nr:zinc transporter 10 [Brachionus plicatilis]
MDKVGSQKIKNDSRNVEVKNTFKCRLTKTVLISTITIFTSLFFFVELIVGYMSNSNALIADSFHMLGDVISLTVGLTALRFSKKESSSSNTFGWARAEVVGSMVNAVFFVALCLTIVTNSISRFLKPEPMEKIDLMLGVGGAGLVINVVSLSMFALQTCQEKKSQEKKKDMNMNLHGVFLSTMVDSLGSIAVVFGALMIKFVPPLNSTGSGWKLYIDPTLSLIIAGIIMVSAAPLLKKSILILLQSVPKNLDLEELKQRIGDVDGVVSVHQLHVWSLNQEKVVATVHIKILEENDMETNWSIVKKVKCILSDRKINMTTVQIGLEEEKEELGDEESGASVKECYSNLNFTTIDLNEELDVKGKS